MIKTVCIIGFGSIGQKHYNELLKLKKIKKIYIFSRRNLGIKNQIKEFKNLININPDYFIISTETSTHEKYLNKLNELFKNKVILVEKPLSHKSIKKIKTKNYIFVGYNLRFHPIIIYLKNILLKNKFWYSEISCNSYLPNWRKKIDYQNHYSAFSKKGGGVLLDLSHELDYANLLFGKLTTLNYIIGKVSNLKLKSEDLFILLSKTKKLKLLKITLSYFSKFEERKLILYGNNLQIKADLIKNEIVIYKNKKYKTLKFKTTINDTYLEMHKSIIKNDFSKFSTLKSSLKLLEYLFTFKK